MFSILRIGELLNEKSEGRRLWKRGKPRKSRKDQDNGAVNSHPNRHNTLHKRFSQTLCVAVKTSLGLVRLDRRDRREVEF